jgi:hypothetical protein
MDNTTMKKAFIALMVLFIVIIFSALILFIFEIKALNNENSKNEYLYTQGKLHLHFLQKVVDKVKHEPFETLTLQQAPFELHIKKTPLYFECYVFHNTENIRLVKRIKR